MRIYDYSADPRFEKLVGFVLRSEGGYVNHPDDPGGPTKCGIALNYNSLICRQFGIVDAASMRDKMTPDIAKQIYFHKYWTAVACEKIASDRLAYIHFDCAVNCGVGAASSAMIKLTSGAKLPYFEADGKNIDLWWKAFVEYEAARLRYYVRCKNRKPFIDGWINRICDVIDTAIKLPD